ncbi:MAG: carbohydrate porin [Verrucomicrobiota bacterium]
MFSSNFQPTISNQSRRHTAFALLVAATCVSSAPAQEDNELAVETWLISDAFGKEYFQQNGLTGHWFGWRKDLANHGIHPFATFTGEFLANVDGGISTGSAWNGIIDFGIELNLESLVGWPGASFFTNTYYFRGNDLSSDYVGDFNGVSNIYTDTDINVFNIFFQQHLFEGKIRMKVGQIAADDDFMVADNADVFVNSAFGTPSLESGNIPAPIFPLAAPGAYIHVRAVDGVTLQTAIYAGDAGPVQSNNHGFSWRAGGGAGWAWFGELGFEYQLVGHGELTLGGFYATGEFTSFANGSAENGLGAVYVQIDHNLLDPKDDPLGLGFFMRGGATPDDTLATVAASIEAGLVVEKIIWPTDKFGLGVAHTIFADDYLNDSRANGTPVSTTETIIEATYEMPLAQWLAIQPDLQYIFDPHYSNQDALVLGVRAEMVF